MTRDDRGLVTEERFRPTWAEIDLSAVRGNARALVGLARAKGLNLFAVVKANAYGHGAVECARAALAGGATGLAVATVEEGIGLRRGGIGGQILVMGAYVPGTARAYVEHQLDVTVASHEQAKAVGAESRALVGSGSNHRLRAHLKVDTGMSRLGVRPEEAIEASKAIADAQSLHLHGVFTHLATADEEDRTFTVRQLRMFDDVLTALEARGVRPPQKHALNSGGLLQHDPGRTNACRVGIALYGLLPSPHLHGAARLLPALTWKSAVVAVKRVPKGVSVSYGSRHRTVRETTLAALPVGYADGFSRLLSGRASVLIRGKRYPVVGAICMDQAIVDVGNDAVAPGDHAVLIGRYGAERIEADELAQMLGTINYEVVCSISSRVPRVHIDGD